MIRVIFPGSTLTDLRRDLLTHDRESCAVVLARHAPVDVDASRLLVVSVEIAPEAAYSKRDSISAALTPEYLTRVAGRARRANLSMIFIHTHPGSFGEPQFSTADDDGEVLLATFAERRIPNIPHLALLIGPDGVACRRLGQRTRCRVEEINARLIIHDDTSQPVGVSPTFERQVRAFGADGQKLLQQIAVGIVGLGGTGSATVQQLSHLGVGHFILMDPDRVEAHNLNRLVGATTDDVGRPKVEVAARNIRRINPSARVVEIKSDVVEKGAFRRLLGADFLFCCTDNHASRAVLGQIAYQYLLPCIDMGITIAANGGEIAHVSGRAQMLAPGLACLTCTSALDAKQIRAELMTPDERAVDPYIVGFHEPQPAVISLNGTVASLAVTMFLGAVTPIGATARFQHYDGIRGVVRSLHKDPNPACVVCSTEGALTQGDLWPLPGRIAST